MKQDKLAAKRNPKDEKETDDMWRLYIVLINQCLDCTMKFEMH